MASQSEKKGKQSAAHDEDSSKKMAQKNEAQAPDSGDSQELDSLISTLEGDLSSIDNDAALGLLDHWYDALHKASEP